MVWGQWRKFLVLAGCHASKFSEVPVEMRLVTIAGIQSNIDFCRSLYSGVIQDTLNLMVAPLKLIAT